MNIVEKVNELLKYCSAYQGHTYMMDERRENQDFQVTLPEEEEVRENLDTLQFILLTGEAGDGKSRLLRVLRKELKKHGFQVYFDFSAEMVEEQKKIIEKVEKIISGQSDEHIIVAANVGIFTRAVLSMGEQTLEKLNIANNKVKIINFEKRNLAHDPDVFQRIVKTFLAYDGKMCDASECHQYQNCMFKRNIDFLLSEQGMESMRVLCNTICLIGEHVTFRELLSLLAYTVTFGENCDKRKEWEADDAFSYENIFDRIEDKVLQNIRRMDPANKNINCGKCETIEECKKKKRDMFFKTEGNKYQYLAVDYLAQFQKVIRQLQKENFIDSGAVQEGELYYLKRGLGRLTRRGQSDLAMKVMDTPTMLGNDIQTEFEIGDIDIIWHRYGLDFDNIESDNHVPEEQNRFCMSYVYEGENQSVKAITMVIDYRLFRYLMMADEFYFLSHNSKSIEEYTINTFFRKILKVTNGAYEKMIVKFADSQQGKFCSFSLNYQEKNQVLFHGKKVIKLKKEG